MELSLEEAVDLILEVIGCGVVIFLIQLMLRSAPIIELLERMV